MALQRSVHTALLSKKLMIAEVHMDILTILIIFIITFLCSLKENQYIKTLVKEKNFIPKLEALYTHVTWQVYSSTFGAMHVFST